jgi:hypothetical protein
MQASSYNRWSKLFLFCIGMAIATTFIMEWLATDFWIGDQKFSIIGLELCYSKDKIITILSGIKPPAKMALYYQLVFDFAFMAGVYPAIASFCMMTREKIGRNGLRNLLFGLAMIQPVAWVFDIIENSYLLNWVEKPVIGDEFMMYHNIVAAKWIIVIAGALTAIIAWIFKKTINKKS